MNSVVGWGPHVGLCKILIMPLLGLSGIGCLNSGTEPSGVPFVTDIATGLNHTCALTSIGRIECWGMGQWGQLGNGKTEKSAVSVRVLTSRQFVSLEAGMFHNCATTGNEANFCWGANFNGELGIGTESLDPETAPVPVRGGQNFVEISAGESHTCGITTFRTTFCWGAPMLAGTVGRLPNELLPKLLNLGPLVTIAVGLEIVCAVALDRTTYCWGDQPPGIPLGPGQAITQEPLPVVGAPNLVAISVGVKHACGATAAPRVFCWGQNGSGVVGNGTNDLQLTPVEVSGNLDLSGVSSGPAHACALALNGEAYCWGSNFLGRLGNSGIANSSNVPVRSAEGLLFQEIDAGGAHTCGLTFDGSVYCWGAGKLGQLGSGRLEDSTEPQMVVVGRL
jgi:alpha-tubulin suppressor-like RCC1 family protein